MTLHEAYSAHSAPSDFDSIARLWLELTRNGKPPADSVTWHVVEHALALAKQGRIDLAEICVIEISRQFDMTLEHYFDICMLLYQNNPSFSSTKIFSYYLKNGGVRREAFELEITNLYLKNNTDMVIDLFKKINKWIPWKSINPDVLFLVANSFMTKNRLDECFVVMSHIVDENPNNNNFRNNMIYLALNLKYDPARDYFTDSINNISKSYKNTPAITHSDEANFVVDYNKSQNSDIVSALHHYGLCHIKNGIDIDRAKEILEYLKENESRLNFPIGFDAYITERVTPLLRFSAASIVNAVLPAPSAMDQGHCVVRKVDPVAAQSFTPFHQDATAFHKAIVNIWTPLTPAGGDYPTIELVRRRLSFAEATMETSDDYNLVKIDDAEILRKYQGDLYEPTDVEPGECIIFLGTTIHRSTNLKAATKPRYNLEIRWA